MRRLGCYGCRVGTPELGLYLTLSEEARPGEGDRPALGPFDELTVRSARVVGERGKSGRILAAHGPNGGWLGVDADLQRSFATDSVPTSAKLSHIRVHAYEAQVFLSLFDDAPDPWVSVPELGPFDVVVIGTNDIGADGRTIAVRVSPTAPWLLTDLAGPDLQGVAKTVLIFRAAISATGPAPRRSAGPSVEKDAHRDRLAHYSDEESDPSPVSEAPPSVWVDRVRARSDIYISRPDVSKKR